MPNTDTHINKHTDKQKTKVLHLCKVYLPIKGGVQKVVQILTTVSKQYLHQVLTTGEDGSVRKQKMDDATVTRCRSYLQLASLPVAPSMLLEARKKVQDAQIICVHYPFPLADLALFTKLRLPPIVVFWHSNIVVQKKLKWLAYPFIFVTLMRANRIVVTSQNMIDNSRLLTLFKSKVDEIPFGLPELSSEDNQETTKSGKYFLLIGRHVSYKGIDIAIKAMVDSDSKLVIAGDGPLFERHKLLVESLNLKEKVTFHRHVSDQQITKLIKASVGLIMPSIMHNEAFGLVQLEAMRQKKPVINTWLPSSVPTIARDQLEGITVKPEDTQALAQAMDKLYKDDSLAKQLGHNGYDRFISHYTDTRFKKRIESLFEKILKETSSK